VKCEFSVPQWHMFCEFIHPLKWNRVSSNIKKKLKVNNSILNLSKIPITKVNSQNRIYRLKLMHYQYSVGAILKSFHSTMNRHFGYNSFVRLLTKWYIWTQFGSSWRLSVKDMLWLLFLPTGNEPGLMLFLQNFET
jgi:hypothetical protein